MSGMGVAINDVGGGGEHVLDEEVDDETEEEISESVVVELLGRCCSSAKSLKSNRCLHMGSGK